MMVQREIDGLVTDVVIVAVIVAVIVSVFVARSVSIVMMMDDHCFHIEHEGVAVSGLQSMAVEREMQLSRLQTGQSARIWRAIDWHGRSRVHPISRWVGSTRGGNT